MSTPLAIIAALPREVAGLVRGITPDSALREHGVHLYRLPGAVVVVAGMGRERAAAAVQAALPEDGVKTLVSTGLAGACGPQWTVGSVLAAELVIDARTGERFSADAGGTGHVLASTESIASVGEKTRLAATYNADLVDMEAATVARLAVAHGLRFRAVKAVSDSHDFELVSLDRFSGKHGSFRTRAFALHTAVRPHTWRHAIHLGRNSARALAALQVRLRAIVAEAAE